MHRTLRNELTTRMRNHQQTLIAALSALAAGSAFAGTVTAPAPAPTTPSYEASLHVGYTNEYIFRGVEYGDDLIEAGIDVSTEWNGLGFAGGVWYGSVQSSRLMHGVPAGLPTHYDELDLYGEVSKDLGFATAKLGYIYRHYDAVSLNGYKLIDDQQEVYVGLSRELFWGIEGSLTYFWDVEYDNGGYTELGFKKSFELCDKTSLDLASSTGYLVEEGQLSYTALTASLNYKVTETATLTPFIGLSIELDEADNGFSNFNLPGALGLDNDQGNQLFGGVKFAVSF